MRKDEILENLADAVAYSHKSKVLEGRMVAAIEWAAKELSEAKPCPYCEKGALDGDTIAPIPCPVCTGKPFELPELNDDLIDILGRPNFTCYTVANLLRKNGQEIRRKAEHEQAAVIHYFLKKYLEFGDKWRDIANKELEEIYSR